jgi:hypothetical protein
MHRHPLQLAGCVLTASSRAVGHEDAGECVWKQCATMRCLRTHRVLTGAREQTADQWNIKRSSRKLRTALLACRRTRG